MRKWAEDLEVQRLVLTNSHLGDARARGGNRRSFETQQRSLDKPQLTLIKYMVPATTWDKYETATYSLNVWPDLLSKSDRTFEQKSGKHINRLL